VLKTRSRILSYITATTVHKNLKLQIRINSHEISTPQSETANENRRMRREKWKRTNGIRSRKKNKRRVLKGIISDYLRGGATRFAEDNLVKAIDSFAELNIRRRRRCRGFFLFATHDNVTIIIITIIIMLMIVPKSASVDASLYRF